MADQTNQNGLGSSRIDARTITAISAIGLTALTTVLGGLGMAFVQPVRVDLASTQKHVGESMLSLTAALTMLADTVVESRVAAGKADERIEGLSTLIGEHKARFDRTDEKVAMMIATLDTALQNEIRAMRDLLESRMDGLDRRLQNEMDLKIKAREADLHVMKGTVP